MGCKLTKEERETILVMDEETKMWHCFIHNTRLANKAKEVAKILELPITECEDGAIRVDGIPSKLVSINLPRTMSNEAKAKLSERMSNMHKVRSSNE